MSAEVASIVTDAMRAYIGTALEPRETEIRNQHGELIVRLHSTTARLPATSVEALAQRS